MDKKPESNEAQELGDLTVITVPAEKTQEVLDFVANLEGEED